MKGIMSGTDIWCRGAAAAFSKDESTVTKQERQLFKEVFFNTMWHYMYQSDEANLESIKNTIDQFAQCIRGGLSFEATKQYILNNLPEDQK